MDRKAEVDFGFASFSDRTFELIARDIKTGKEITLYGTLRPEQTIDQIDQVLPTCVYVRGATISRLTAELEAERARSVALCEGWLYRFKDFKPQYTSAQDYAADAVKDIRDAIRDGRQPDVTPTVTDAVQGGTK